MTGQRLHTRARARNSGASLILAIGFMLMVGLISGGLASLATSGLNNRNTLQLVRDRQYSADGAIEEAIAKARTSSCSSPTPSTLSTMNNITIRVDWVNACQLGANGVKSSDGTPYDQRNVIFTAYCANPQTDVRCNFTDVIIRAQVNFEPAAGTVTKTYVQSWSINR